MTSLIDVALRAKSSELRSLTMAALTSLPLEGNLVEHELLFGTRGSPIKNIRKKPRLVIQCYPVSLVNMFRLYEWILNLLFFSVASKDGSELPLERFQIILEAISHQENVKDTHHMTQVLFGALKR